MALETEETSNETGENYDFEQLSQEGYDEETRTLGMLIKIIKF